MLILAMLFMTTAVICSARSRTREAIQYGQTSR